MQKRGENIPSGSMHVHVVYRVKLMARRGRRSETYIVPNAAFFFRRHVLEGWHENALDFIGKVHVTVTTNGGACTTGRVI